MAVCDRICCENTCNTYVPGIGHICDECKKEFKKYLERDMGNAPLSSDEMKLELDWFMRESEKGDFNYQESICADDFFKQYSQG